MTAYLLFSIVFGLNTARAEIWDSFNDPSLFDPTHQYEYQLANLPAQAMLTRTPWSETYWPSYRGSINIRWNSPTQDGFNYTPPTEVEAKAMTLDQLKMLSPSEKYDLFMGKYDYPTWTEVKRYARPTAGIYTGLCDGWSIARNSVRRAERSNSG